MAEDSHPSRYVKLTRDQDAPAEDIRPGELNQPVHVPQLEGRKCSECGQVLPETYEPPADEPWTTGIFGCTDDPESCRTGLFCPCVLFGRNVEALREDIPWTTPCVCHAVFVEGGIALAILTAIFHGVDPRTSFLIGEGLVFSWWLCGTYTGIFRQELQKRYHLAALNWAEAQLPGRELAILPRDSRVPPTHPPPPLHLAASASGLRPPLTSRPSPSRPSSHPTSVVPWSRIKRSSSSQDDAPSAAA